MTAMAKLYLIKIKEGKLTIDDVPAKWKEEVKQALENLS